VTGLAEAEITLGEPGLTISGTPAVDVVLRVTSAVARCGLELDDGQSIGVSGAGEARIRYDAGANEIQFSANGAAYTLLGVAPTGAYTMNNVSGVLRTLNRTDFTMNQVFDFLQALVTDLVAAGVSASLTTT